MLIVAPLLKSLNHGVPVVWTWSLLFRFDSLWYGRIAVSGYEYINDGHAHSVAFFPLFPLSLHALISIDLPVELAGILVNNLAFFAGVIIFYIWTKELYGTNVARWTTSVLTLFPMSLFGTVAYSEGLYILFSTAALKAFDRQQYSWLSLWGAIATATRPTGIALVPAFLLASWRENRPIKAYFASLATGGGLFIYSLYCQVKFGDALAFVNAQKGWNPLGFNWKGWSRMFLDITVGWINQNSGRVKDPIHVLLFITIVISFGLLWFFRKRLDSGLVDYSFFGLIIFLWLLGSDPLIYTVSVLGSAYLLWHLRIQLSSITLTYGLCSLGLILASGGTFSLSRLVYGVVSFNVALGLLLSRYPRWGYASMVFFTILMVTMSIRFAQGLWVA